MNIQFKQLKQFLQNNTNQFNNIFHNAVICVSNGHIHMTPDGKFGTFADFAVRKAHYGAHFSVLYRTSYSLQEPKFFYATRNTTFNGTIRINKNAIELWRHYGYPMNILAFGCNNCYYTMDKEELKQRAEEAIKTEECDDKYYFLSTKDEWKPLKTEFTKEDYAFGEKINFRYLQNYVFAKHSNGHNVTCKFPDGREMQAKSRTSLYKWLKDNANAICSERAFVNHILANKPIKCQYKGQQIELIITDNTTTRSKLFDNEKSAPKLNVFAMEDKFNNGLELTTLDNLAGTHKQFFIINKLIAANKNDKGKLSISNDNFGMENYLFEADEESLDVQMKHAEEIRNKLYMVTSSGNKSIHCIIHTNYTGHDKACYKYIWRRLAEEYFPGMAMDSACSNNARKSRTPNAIRDNGNVQKLLWTNDVTIDVSNFVDDFNSIAAAAAACRRAYDRESYNSNYSALPAVKKYFASEKGSRNNCAYKAAYAMLANNYSEDETLEMLRKGPLEANEITSVLQSAKRR